LGFGVVPSMFLMTYTVSAVFGGQSLVRGTRPLPLFFAHKNCSPGPGVFFFRIYKRFPIDTPRKSSFLLIFLKSVGGLVLSCQLPDLCRSWGHKHVPINALIFHTFGTRAPPHLLCFAAPGEQSGYTTTIIRQVAARSQQNHVF